MATPRRIQSRTTFKPLTHINNCNSVDPNENDGSTKRMDELLRLRKALNAKNISVRDKNLTVNLSTPKNADCRNKFEDNEEDEDELKFTLAEKDLQGGDENEGPSNSRRGHSEIVSKINLKSPREPHYQKSVGLSSQAFRNQLSSRFKSTSQKPRRIASSDNESL